MKVTTQNTIISEIVQGYMTKLLQKPHLPIVVTAAAPFSKGITEAAARGTGSLLVRILL